MTDELLSGESTRVGYIDICRLKIVEPGEIISDSISRRMVPGLMRLALVPSVEMLGDIIQAVPLIL